MDKTLKIVVLDDDIAYCKAISDFLSAQGCDTLTISDPNELDAALARHNPDLLLLDQRLGGTTGTQMLLAMRRHSRLPCIVVSGASDPVDRIVNLEVGADDEIDKSVAPRELLARIRAVLRRPAIAPTKAAADPTASSWKFLIPRRQLLKPDGKECHLTAAEFETLRLLVDSVGSALPRAVLCQRVFGRAYTHSDRAVDTVIKKLRAKIDPPGSLSCIRSVRPTGYVFTGFPLDHAAVPEL